MATFNEIIYNIKNIANRGYVTNDDDLNDNLIAFWVNGARAKLIEAMMLLNIKANKPVEFPYTSLQYINYVPLEAVDLSALPEEISCSINTGCHVLRSKYAIPKIIASQNVDSLVSVLSIDGSEQYSRTYRTVSKWKSFRPYVKHMKRFYLYNDYLYLLNDSLQEFVSITGVFTDPEEVHNFNQRVMEEYSTGCKASCYTRDDKYPATDQMIQDITNSVLKERYGIIYSMPIDRVNDSLGTKYGQGRINQDSQGSQDNQQKSQENG